MLPSSSPCELLADSALLFAKFTIVEVGSEWISGCSCWEELAEGGVALAPPFFLFRTAWLSFFSFCSCLNTTKEMKNVKSIKNIFNYVWTHPSTHPPTFQTLLQFWYKVFKFHILKSRENIVSTQCLSLGLESKIIRTV